MPMLRRLCALLILALVIVVCSSCSKQTTQSASSIPAAPPPAIKHIPPTKVDSRIVTIVKQVCGAKPDQLMGTSNDGTEIAVDGVAVAVPEAKAGQLVNDLTPKVRPLGYIAYTKDGGTGSGSSQAAIGILKGKDRSAIVKAMGTNGDNYNISNADVIAKLRDWEKRCSFEMTNISFDTIDIHFKTLPADMDAFAKEVYKFCPDAVEQGAGSVSELSKDIKSSKELTLWWD